MSVVSKVDKPLRIIGIGSPFGADRIGWRVAEYLARSVRLPKTFEVLTRDRPGVMLLNDMHGVERVVLVDAVCSNRVSGQVRHLTVDDAIAHYKLFSSHGFGVGEALSLGRVLGELPRELTIFGIEIPVDGGGFSGDEIECMARGAAEFIVGELLG